MWLLLMVLFAQLPTRVAVLSTYPTAESCQQARDHVGFEMAEAYPHERDFIIICVKQHEGGAS